MRDYTQGPAEFNSLPITPQRRSCTHGNFIEMGKIQLSGPQVPYSGSLMWQEHLQIACHIWHIGIPPSVAGNYGALPFLQHFHFHVPQEYTIFLAVLFCCQWQTLIIIFVSDITLYCTYYIRLSILVITSVFTIEVYYI